MSIKWLTGTFEKSRVDSRRISFIASHEKVDRDSELILVDGIDLADFSRNPLLLCQHNRQEVAVGRVENLRRTKIDGAAALVGEAVFLDRPHSNDTLADIRAGLLNAVSIGFQVLQRGAPVLPDQHGHTYTKTRLIEISVVSLPACPTCVITAKGKCATCAGEEDINLENIEVPTAETGKSFSGCPLGRKCPTSALSHPDLCILTACPLKAGNQSGGKKAEDDVLAGIMFPSMELELEDEAEHVLQPVATINRIIRETLRESVRDVAVGAVRKEINYLRGRVD